MSPTTAAVRNRGWRDVQEGTIVAIPSPEIVFDFAIECPTCSHKRRITIENVAGPFHHCGRWPFHPPHECSACESLYWYPPGAELENLESQIRAAKDAAVAAAARRPRYTPKPGDPDYLEFTMAEQWEKDDADAFSNALNAQRAGVPLERWATLTEHQRDLAERGLLGSEEDYPEGTFG